MTMMKTTIFSDVCQKAGRDTFQRGTRTHTQPQTRWLLTLNAEEGKLKALIRLWFPINSSVPSEQNTSHTHIVTSEHSYTLRRSLPSTHALWESNNPSGLF